MASKLSSNRVHQETCVFGTFGIYRYFLAVTVTLGHIYSGNIRFGGAVFAFFVLSGYVVSYILCNNYLLLHHGLRKYFLNRILRIYPSYWVACAMMVWLLGKYPAQIHDMLSSVDYLHGLSVISISWWAINLSLIGLSIPPFGIVISPTLLAVAWSLSVEILYWAFIPQLILHSSLRRAVVIAAVTFTFSIALCFMWLSKDIPLISYYSPLAASLPFCLGMLIFYRKGGPHRIISHALGGLGIVLCVVMYFYGPSIFASTVLKGNYVLLALNTFIVAYLSQIDIDSLPPMLQRLDLFLGNLAYPMYLCHLPAALVVRITYPHLIALPWFYNLGVFTLVSFMAIAMHYCIEIPINRYIRRWVKS